MATEIDVGGIVILSEASKNEIDVGGLLVLSEASLNEIDVGGILVLFEATPQLNPANYGPLAQMMG